MATVPTPYTAAAGDKLSATVFNTGVKDVFNWLMDGIPRCHVWDSSGFSVPNAATTLITFDSESYDNDSMHNTAVNTSRITFTTGGRYDVDILLTIGNATYTNLDLNVRLNAGGATGGGTSIRTQPFSDGTRGQVNVSYRIKRVFVAGDYIECFLNQASGGARILSATSQGTRVYAERLSAT